jgi:hypothetical protein
MSENKKPPSFPQLPTKPVFDHIRESNKTGADHRPLDYSERKSETTVYRTRPVPDPGKK